MREESEHVRVLYRHIYQVVRKIPRGSVATYGQVAELAGIPGGARVAGAAMKTSTPADRLPWQRVIGKAGKLRGRIAIHDPVGAAVQRRLLEAEGVTVGDTGFVVLDVYGWLAPDQVRGPKRTSRADGERRERGGRASANGDRRERGGRASADGERRERGGRASADGDRRERGGRASADGDRRERVTSGSGRGASPRRPLRSGSKRRASSSRR
jgi:methylated-DNA-protein-cysteine methyltransferase-like protein